MEATSSSTVVDNKAPLSTAGAVPRPEPPPTASTSSSLTPPGSPRSLDTAETYNTAFLQDAERGTTDLQEQEEANEKKSTTTKEEKVPSLADAVASSNESIHWKKKGKKAMLQVFGSNVPSSRPCAPSTTSSAQLPSPKPSLDTSSAVRTFLSTGHVPASLPRAPISFVSVERAWPSRQTEQVPPPPPPHAVYPSTLAPSTSAQDTHPSTAQGYHSQPYSPYTPYPDPSARDPYTLHTAHPTPFPTPNPHNPYDPTLAPISSAPYQPYGVFSSSLADFPAPAFAPHHITSAAPYHPYSIVPPYLADFSTSTLYPQPPLISSTLPGAAAAATDVSTLLHRAVEENGVLRERLSVFAMLNARDNEKLAEQIKVVERLQKEFKPAETSETELKVHFSAAQRREEDLVKRVNQLEKEADQERRAKEKLEKEHTENLESEQYSAVGRLKAEQSRAEELKLEVDRLKREKNAWERDKETLEKRTEPAEDCARKLRVREREEGQVEKECQHLRKELDIRDSILDIAKTDHTSASSALRAEHTQALSRLKEAHDADIIRLRLEHEAAIKAIQHNAALKLAEERAWVERLSKEQVGDNSRAKREQEEWEREKGRLEEEIKSAKRGKEEAEDKFKRLQEHFFAQGRAYNVHQAALGANWAAKLRLAVDEVEKRVEHEKRGRAEDGKQATQKLVEHADELGQVKEQLTARDQALNDFHNEAATNLDELLAAYKTGQKEKEMLERRVMALEKELEEGRKDLSAVLRTNDSSRRATSIFLPPGSIGGGMK
ncbi:hypothetical protein JCM11251_002296 [Rhodosporidiobolus azoricus]